MTCILPSMVIISLINIIPITEAKYQLKHVELPHDLKKDQIFSDERIAKFDGTNPEGLIYMAIKGVVFDVTSGGDFYAPGHSYNVLTGKDCTRATAKMSLEPEDLNKDISDLADDYLESLDSVYEGTYVKKYPIVGYMEYLVEEHVPRVKSDL